VLPIVGGSPLRALLALAVAGASAGCSLLDALGPAEGEKVDLDAEGTCADPLLIGRANTEPGVVKVVDFEVCDAEDPGPLPACGQGGDFDRVAIEFQTVVDGVYRVCAPQAMAGSSLALGTDRCSFADAAAVCAVGGCAEAALKPGAHDIYWAGALDAAACAPITISIELVAGPDQELCLNGLDDDDDGAFDCGDSDCFGSAACQTELGDEVCDGQNDAIDASFPMEAVDELACRCLADAGCGQVGSPFGTWLCHDGVALAGGPAAVCGPDCNAFDWCARVGKVCQQGSGRCVVNEEVGPCFPGGSPCWREPVSLSTDPFQPLQLDAGDFDGDGFPDLAIRTDGDVTLLFGGRDATAPDVRKIVDGAALIASFVNTGAGARQQLAVVLPSEDIRTSRLVIFGAKLTSPREPLVVQEVSLLPSPRAIAALELAPVDAFTDFVAVEDTAIGRVTLLAGPDYAPAVTSLALLGLDPNRVRVGDLNGDRIDDISAFAGGELRLITGTAEGGIEPSASVSLGDAALAQPFGPRVAVAVACDDCRSLPLLRLFDARGAERGRVTGLADRFTPSAIAADRLDGDLIPDLVLGNADSKSGHTVLAVRGSGDTLSAEFAALPTSAEVTCLAVANLDSDGPPEIVACTRDKRAVLVFPGAP
jgi:hypothetical protein